MIRLKGVVRCAALRRRTLLCVLCGTSGLTACTESRTKAAESEAPAETLDAREMLSDLTKNVYIATYAEFGKASEHLAEEVDTFCERLESADPEAASDAGVDAGIADSEPLDEGLRDARDAWFAARARWKEAEAFAFGPYRDVPERIGPKVDTWPVRVERVRALLDDDTELSAEVFSELGSTSKGLPVLEFLLFEESELREGVRLFWLAMQNDDGRRCELLRVASHDLAAQGQYMLHAWRDGPAPYARELTQAGRESEAFPSLRAAVGEIVNRMVFAVENVREMKLGGPAGLTVKGEVDLNAFESIYSDNGATDALNAIRSARNVYLGDYEVDGLGTQDYVLATNPSLDAEVRKAFGRTTDALEPIRSFASAVHDDPAALKRAYDALKELQLVLGVDLAAAVGATVMFNDTDGD